MNPNTSVLHLSSGFPIVIGLHHVEDYKKIKVSDENDVLEYRRSDGLIVQGFGVKHGYHHYVITTRPRCMFVKEGFSWDKENGIAVGNLEFEVRYKQYVMVPFKLLLNGSSPYPFPAREGMSSAADIDDILICESQTGFPNRLVFQTKGKRNCFFLEPDLLHFIKLDDSRCKGILDFCVEYIGISTGEQGGRDFADRLWNHEKVRAISGVIQRDSPNLQVYVFGYQARYVIEPFPGRFIENSKILECKLGLPRSAQVLEAALIKHFQPAFNEDRKGFMSTEFPDWLPELREILAPSYEGRECGMSVVMAPDCRNNPHAEWIFGGFYTEHTQSRGLPNDMVQFYLDLAGDKK